VSQLGHTVIHEQVSYVGEDGTVTYEGVYEAVSLQSELARHTERVGYCGQLQNLQMNWSKFIVRNS